jgi:hypothetical protein
MGWMDGCLGDERMFPDPVLCINVANFGRIKARYYDVDKFEAGDLR